MQVSDLMIVKATVAYMKETGAEAHQLDGWFEPAIRAALEAALPAAGPQCCMCGKKGLSTIEGDGGTECELSDGRWVCSAECWDRAVEPALSAAARAFDTNKEMLTAFGAEDIREGSRMCFEDDGADTWEDYYEVPFHALDRIRSALSAQEMDVATHRHKKRGSEYVLIGVGKIQAEDWFCWPENKVVMEFVDMREVAIYRSVDDGSLWARPVEEFNDGRFEPLAAAPAKQEGGE